MKHSNGFYEKIPYFCLPATDLNDVIAPSCYSCFDYTNAGADLVVGYMGAPFEGKDVPMTQHLQQVTVRNSDGHYMLNKIRNRLDISPAVSTGWLSKESLVMQTVLADDEIKVGNGPKQGAPRLVGELIASLLNLIGPKVNSSWYMLYYKAETLCSYSLLSWIIQECLTLLLQYKPETSYFPGFLAGYRICEIFDRLSLYS